MNWYRLAQYRGMRTLTMGTTLPYESPFGEVDVTVHYWAYPGEERSWDSPGYGPSVDIDKIVNDATGEDMLPAIQQWNPQYIDSLEQDLIVDAGEQDEGAYDAHIDMKMDQMKEERHGLI